VVEYSVNPPHNDKPSIFLSMNDMEPKNSSNINILIIGAGTWGCSVALELARRGHTDITVLDGNNFPSAISAGNDLNKIAEEGTSKTFQFLCLAV
jgi:NADPH-dependent 2,4-dienoyl-CoA reductase/sulfur reductase-like enzyme